MLRLNQLNAAPSSNLLSSINPRRKQVQSLRDTCIDWIVKRAMVISEFHLPQLYEIMLRNPKRCKKIMLNLANNLKNYLFSSLPLEIYNYLCDKILNAIRIQVYDVDVDAMEEDIFSDFVLSINTAFTNMKVHGLQTDLVLYEMPKNLGQIILRNLRTLELTVSLSGADDFQNLNECLRNSPNILSFTFKKWCTDEIIQMVTRNCRKLLVLDVLKSQGVTDRSVQNIKNCRALRKIDLDYTSVTPYGAAKLLMEIASLLEVNACNQTSLILDLINIESANKNFTLNLERLSLSVYTARNLSLAVKMCPKIKVFIMRLEELNCDTGHFLAQLEYLENLILYDISFYVNRIPKFIEIKGFNLVKLNLQSTTGIDFQGLICVARHCQNLIEFQVESCKFQNDYFVFPPTMQQEFFPKLEIHKNYNNDMAMEYLEFIMLNSASIKSYQLGITNKRLHDGLFQSILSVNPMLSLEEVSIHQPCLLSMSTIRLLMDKCPRFNVFCGVEKCEMISEEELEHFREELKENNIDIAL